MWLQKATVRNVTRALKEVKAHEWEGDYRPGTRAALKEIVERGLTNEIDEFLARKRYERAQGPTRLYRNGGYFRHLITELGDVVIRVPALRRGFKFRALKAYSRRAQHIDRLILGCFVLGLSTRKVAPALVCLLGERISPQLVSDIARSLDAHVARFHNRPLKDRYRFVCLDGVVLTHRAAVGVKRRFILVALGMTKEGRKELIDYQLSPGESQGAWEGFLNSLYHRGLKGEGLELIITDGGAGLMAALEVVYPGIDRQHCWAHKARNVLDKVPKAHQPQVKRALNAVSNAPNRRAATRAFWGFCNRYRPLYPAAVRSLERHIDPLLSFHDVKPQPHQDPKALAKTIRTTNAIERAFREVKRRTRPMGVFVNKHSIERILFAVFHYYNHQEGDGPPFLFTENS